MDDREKDSDGEGGGGGGIKEAGENYANSLTIR